MLCSLLALEDTYFGQDTSCTSFTKAGTYYGDVYFQYDLAAVTVVVSREGGTQTGFKRNRSPPSRFQLPWTWCGGGRGGGGSGGVQ